MIAQASQLQPDSDKQFNESRYEDFFTRLTGNKPYPYQTKLVRELTQGKSLILRAPTGSGKTWATVAPFIYAAARNNKFADRLIYALPLRALASNLHETTNAKLKTLEEFQGRVCSSAKNRRYRSDDPFYLGLQMGGQQQDPFFEGDVTFTTIDQLLSSYLFAPVSLPGRVGNIGAGALIGSFLVFDEVHLLDPQRSLATTIEMLVRLKGLAQFVLMTATMPDSVMEWMASKLDATPISLSPDEVQQLPSHAKKQREFEWRSSPLNAEDIVSAHKSRTIAIVNTVGRAQEIFGEVCNEVKIQANPPLVFLLHSRFFQKDREYWESKLADYFGPDATKENAILISTQVVEAGIDISADALLSELAPLNSLLQRAGRVARYANRNIGRFCVFDLPVDSRGRIKLGPYRDIGKIITDTRVLLAKEGNLRLLSYVEELAWLKCVHENSDLAALQPLNSLRTRAQNVLRAMDGLDDAVLRRLVRETESVSIILTSRPEALEFNSRKWPEILSIPRSSLFKLKEACAQSTEWVLKVPEEIESESNQSLDFRWLEIKNPAAVAWLVAINPKFACYAEKVGLELGKPSEKDWEAPYKFSPPVPRYSYHKESFVTHAKRVTEQGARILAKCHTAICKLHQLYKIDLPNIYLLACALHDTGKLQIDWQGKAEGWQQIIDLKLGASHSSEPLAHTEYDPERDRRDKPPDFPPHAACGGFALLDYFRKYFLEDVALLLCTVITRHHGVHTRTLNEFKLIPEAAEILEQCVPDSAARSIQIKLASEPGDCRKFSKQSLLHMIDKKNYWALYASAIRVLRLADQGSFQD